MGANYDDIKRFISTLKMYLDERAVNKMHIELYTHEDGSDDRFGIWVDKTRRIISIEESMIKFILDNNETDRFFKYILPTCSAREYFSGNNLSTLELFETYLYINGIYYFNEGDLVQKSGIYKELVSELYYHIMNLLSPHIQYIYADNERFNDRKNKLIKYLKEHLNQDYTSNMDFNTTGNIRCIFRLFMISLSFIAIEDLPKYIAYNKSILNRQFGGLIRLRDIKIVDFNAFEEGLLPGYIIDVGLKEDARPFAFDKVDYVDILINRAQLDKPYALSDISINLFNELSRLYSRIYNQGNSTDDILTYYISTRYISLRDYELSKFVSDVLSNTNKLSCDKFIRKLNVLKPYASKLYHEFYTKSDIESKIKFLTNKVNADKNLYKDTMGLYDHMYRFLIQITGISSDLSMDKNIVSNLIMAFNQSKIMNDNGFKINTIIRDNSINKFTITIADTTLLRNSIVDIITEKEQYLDDKIYKFDLFISDKIIVSIRNINDVIELINDIINQMKMIKFTNTIINLIHKISDYKIKYNKNIDFSKTMDILVWFIKYTTRHLILYKDASGQDAFGYSILSDPLLNHLFDDNGIDVTGIISGYNDLLSPEINELNTLSYNNMEIITEAPKFISNFFNGLKNHGVRVIEKDYYHLSLLTKNLKELDEIVITLIKVNNRITALSDYIEENKNNLSEDELSRLDKLLHDYMELRIQLANKNTINRPKYGIWRVSDEDDYLI